MIIAELQKEIKALKRELETNKEKSRTIANVTAGYRA